MHTAEGKKNSDNYNSEVRNATVKFAMIDQIRNPPRGFEYVTLQHFYINRDRLIQQLEGWLADGVSQGVLLKTLTKDVETLKKLLHDMKKPTPPKDDDDDDDEEDDDDEDGGNKNKNKNKKKKENQNKNF